MKNVATLVSLLALTTGCQTISGWADAVGDHMPVIGEPCYHWQCVTSEGQRQSDMKRPAQEKTDNAAAATPLLEKEEDEEADEAPAARPTPIFPPSDQTSGTRKRIPHQSTVLPGQ